MVKMPAPTKEYDRKLRELQQLVERLTNGNRMLQLALSQNNIIQCSKVVEQWLTLSRDAARLCEEIALIHQFLITGQRLFVRRDGTMYNLEENGVVGEGDIEIDANSLLLLRDLKSVFGDIPYSLLSIES